MRLLPLILARLRPNRRRRRRPPIYKVRRSVGKRSSSGQDTAPCPSTTDEPDPDSLQAAMEVPITATLGPVGPLLRKLHSIGLQQCPQDEIRLLKVLCILLKDLSEDEDLSCTTQWWIKITRELCYDLEDHLDEVSSVSAHHHYSELLHRVIDASARHQRFQCSHPKTIKPAASRPTSPELPVPVCRRSTVGAVEVPNKLAELLDLDGDDKTLKVIPIHGCAGVGKTTVARTLYHKYGGKFQCRAFVSVSRNPDMRRFLTSMLSQLKAPRLHGFPGVPDLIDAIMKHLEGKRYFIIIDDVWTASVWDIISRAFPRGDHCSRIITTTQIDDVALACCSYDPDNIYKMEPLDDYESRQLFFGKLFGSEDGCPTDIKEMSYEIIMKCGGLPLAIVNIASLFASESNIITEKWKHIHDSLSPPSDEMKDFINLMYNSLSPGSFVVEKGRPIESRGQKTEGKRPAVLAKDNPGDGRSSSSTEMIDVSNLLYSRLPHLMYNSLPPRFRTCLLYLSMYPEGYVIKKNELVKQWVAEGLLRAMEGKDTEEIAEGYFDELVSRGMVQAVDTNNSGEVLSCTVHQMVLDFVRCKSMEENFIITVNYFQSTLALPDKVRRLSVQFGGVKNAYIPESIITSQVRSFIFWGFLKCVPSSIMDYVFLRVLVLHIWTDQEKKSFDLTRMGKLFLLKYLKIESNITIKLPDKIQGLKHLETMQVDARVGAIPSDIVHLPHMLYLSLPSEADLPSGFRHMASLRTLGYFDLSRNSADHVMDLGELTNLQDLHLTCAKIHTDKLDNNMKCLGLILGKLMRLKCLTLAPAVSSHVNTLNCTGASSMGIRFDGFVDIPPPVLKRLELSRHCCIFSRLPDWLGVLVNLCVLKIAVAELWRKDIDVLKGLPALTTFTLCIQAAPAERIVIENVGFHILTYFKLVCPAPCLSFGHGAMPKVQKLKLGFNSNKMEPRTFETVGFHHLTGLTEISVKFGARGADNLDKKAAESALEAAVSNHPNTPILRVQCSYMTFYGDGDKSTVAIRSEDASVKKRHEIQEGKKKTTKTSEEIMNMPSADSRNERTDSLHTPYAQSIDLVTGAMGSLLPKLMSLKSLPKDLREDIESLYRNLKTIQENLHDMADRFVRQDQWEVWAKEVRDLSYDAEDIVDSFLMRVDGSEPEPDPHIKHESIVHKIRRSARQRLSRSRSQSMEGNVEFRDGIKVITQRVKNVLGRSPSHKPQNEDHFVADDPIATSTSDPRDMVGIEIPRDQVIRMLRMKNDAPQLDIVSIVGMGGLGKTTLARAVYDWAEGQFDCRAFVSMSWRPNMEQVFRNIFIQIDQEKYMNINAGILNESLLIDELRGLLANKRYFIVIDDIWNEQLWGKIRSVLIDNKHGSKVVTTSRILKIAAMAGEVYVLKPLSTELSQELFNATLFGGKGKYPIALPEVSEEIIRKCGGLPLAITTVAKLLAGKSSDEWFKMSYCLDHGYEYNEDLVVMRRRLLSSYYAMPSHLRTCLFYLHIFQKDREIKKEILIWKWIAEGFIPEMRRIGLFKLGEEYFNELVDRSLIMPIKDQRHGMIVGCHVHSMVHDSILSLSVGGDFVTILDNKQHTSSQYKARWLSIQNRDAELYESLDSMPIRQIRSFNATMCHFSKALSLSRFKVLRVLAIEECTFTEGRPYHLEQISKLIHLRYLGLYNTYICELPADIGYLRFLQTLDCRGTRVRELPQSVCQLRQLKCLRANDFSTRVPDWMGELTSLEELRLDDISKSANCVKELGKLTQMRELEIRTERLDKDSNKALMESIGNLQEIQALRLNMSFLPGEEANWEGFVPPRQLYDLRMRIASSGLPAWINSSLVHNLSHLSVEVKTVEERDLENLGRLTELISLELLTPSDVFLSISGHPAFPRLSYFGTSAPVRFLPGAMPRLESFWFKVHVPVSTAADFDFGSLGHLPLLQKVEVEISSKGAPDSVNAMYEAVKLAVDNHPNTPNLEVIKTDQVEILTC